MTAHPGTASSPSPGGGPATSTPAISVESLTVRYGEVLALDSIELSVQPGRILGLLGMNGSGKTTLFASLMELVPSEQGRVRLFGGPAAAARRAGRVAYVPQSERVDWDFPITVRQVVAMGRYGELGMLRRLRRADQAAVDAALDRVGLAALQHRQIGALSGGQRKRAFIARAIAQQAELLLLDEPFAGVDTTSQAAITELLRILRDEGRTLVVSTHDLAGVPSLCDEVALLQRRLLFHGPTAEALRPERLAEAFAAGSAAAATGGETS